jgi:phospholipase/carboxylesterase
VSGTRACVVGACLLAGACRRSPTPEGEQTSTTTPPAVTTATPSVRPCTPTNVEVVPPPSAATDTTLVFLHGYGSNAADVAPVARALANAVQAAAITPDGCDPHASGGGARQWMPLSKGTTAEEAARDMREGAARLESWLAPELKARSLPTKRVVFAGFSQGAMLSLHLATHHAPPPAAIVSFSGKLVEVDDAKAPPGLPVLVIHGALDQVIPITAAADAERILIAKGAKVSRLTRPAMAHAIDDESIASAIAFLRESLSTAP